MWNVHLRIGPAELVMAGSLLLLASLVTLFIIEWPVGLVPAATYAVASTAAYTGYRQYAKERMRAEEASRAVRFRVIGSRGVCPAGRHEGDVITVGSQTVTPFVCEEARAVLRMATLAQYDGTAWCCPVFEHLLVFKKEKVAA